MSVNIIPFDPELRKMALEVMKNARTQTYTPERLCELQKVLDAQYYYWWAMDMKKEELALELFTEDFSYYCFGTQDVTAYGQALRSKFANEPLCTMHMGHQPLIWFMSDTEARGIFQYEDHQTYLDNGDQVEDWCVYVDDFVKGEDGAWRIRALRLAYKKMSGGYRKVKIPEDWQPKEWEPTL